MTEELDSSRFVLALLGRLDLRDGTGAEVRSLLGRPKLLGLLAYLAAARPHGFHRRDRLVSIFWPELDQTRARNALRQAIHHLRATLGADVLCTRGDDDVAIDAARLRCDVVVFAERLAAGETAEALELVRGELLPGFHLSDTPEFERWLDEEREHLRRTVAAGAAALAGEAEAAGNLVDAVHWGRRAVDAAPYDEDALRRLLTLLDRAGDRAGAMQAYERSARRLAADLGVDPSPETQTLIAAIRARTSPAASPPEALQRALAGRYLLEREIGQGGMGIVFLARDVALERPVAIKLLPPAWALPGSREQFVKEARAAAALFHPNIVPVHLVETHDDLAFMVMAYVEGSTLRERIAREGPLSVPETLRVLQETTFALSHAHARGVVHGDVKPDNLLLERGTGRIMVTDFGIARRIGGGTQQNAAGMGSPHFMSPEHIAGDPLDGRADLYGLGMTALFALTGALPFDAPTAQAVLTRQLTEPVPPVGTLRPDVPGQLAEAIDRCLAKRPEDRFSSADALAAALGSARRLVPNVAPGLGRFFADVDHLGVDAAGLMFLALMALLPGFAPGRASNFFTIDLDWAFRMWIVLMAGALTIVRTTVCLTGARQLLREGYEPEDVQRAFKARSTAPPRSDTGRSSPWWPLGGAALLVTGYWLVGRDLIADWPVLASLAAELAGLIAAIGVGRAAGARVLSRRGRTPVWWDRLWSGRIGGWFLKLAGMGRRRARPADPAGILPTELVVGRAASAIFDGLDRDTRRQLGEVPDILDRLQLHAEHLRRRLDELERTRAEAGSLGRASRSVSSGGGPDEQLRLRAEHLAASLNAARDHARDKLASVVAAMESIRLNLLRLRAGLGTPEDVTADLEAAREIERTVDAVLTGREETAVLLRAGEPGS